METILTDDATFALCCSTTFCGRDHSADMYSVFHIVYCIANCQHSIYPHSTVMWIIGQIQHT